MKEITKHSGKRSIGLAGIVSFLHVGKGSQGHVLDQNGPKWPTWNTPKKGSLSRKRPKEDERVGGGHFHERVGESPGQDENFGANAFTKSRFVPEIRPFEKKSPGTKFSQIVNISFCSLSFRRAISLDTFNGP